MKNNIKLLGVDFLIHTLFLSEICLKNEKSLDKSRLLVVLPVQFLNLFIDDLKRLAAIVA